MRQRTAQFIITGLIVVACLLGIWNSGSAGLSRLLSAYGSAANSFPEVDQAVQLNPSDPEAHFIRGSMLSSRGEIAEAIREFERATELRPDDYVLWLELAQARDQVDDAQGALVASRQAVTLAPYYAAPRWQLGNLLLRNGQLSEAFTELRLAAASNPTHLPALIDLAWHLAQGNASVAEQLVDPQTAESHLALAQYFRKQGETRAALAHFRAAGSLAKEDLRAWLTELLAAKRFHDAYELWLSGRDSSDEAAVRSTGSVINGGFEKEIGLDEVGFGWRLARSETSLSFALDTNQAREGAASLQLDFHGASDPSLPLLSQLVLVEQNTSYRLRFAARTDEIVTGGLPQIVVVDATSQDQHILTAPQVLPQGNTPWQDYEIDFITGERTEAIQFILQRQKCSSGPCPIFGRLWLDGFVIQNGS